MLVSKGNRAMARMRLGTLMAVGFGGLALLSGCAHQSELIRFKPQYRLGYDDKGDTAALVYGLPDSDDLSLMLECPKGTGRIELSDTAFGKSATAVVLSSGGRTTRVPVRLSEADDGSDDPRVVEGRLTSGAEALQAFRRTGVLDVSGGARHYLITVPADRKAGVERFFKECG